MFSNLTSSQLQHIKNGSAFADMPMYQLDGSAHMHAMSDGKSTNSEQCKKMQEYIKKNMDIYNKYMGMGRGSGRNKGTNESIAYSALGMAMHAAMDSTSPAHVGWQHFGASNFFSHGGWETSLEDLDAAMQAQNLANTMAAMTAVMNGEDICGCGR
jgi:hypothetical protein